ncbi:OprO/OprP family phosphate-selective porin [Methylotenera versatilis]|uniref:Phosphate-selective porin O and P n=1 Tax=Methylotenera versatilis (strain 301) TaxID=666681 RepID=D7DJK2_METV0|nr:porin [Methylotenera versatilis]ADI30237.1 phosphate-selective porin O and P [Methylotenera versatilis 301]
MQINHHFSKSLLVLAITTAFPTTLFAQDDDAAARIKSLELKVQQLIDQRAEQDKQIDVLTKELVGISNQVSQSKIVKSEEKGASKGNPVYANFKEGIKFEDGTGNWNLQFNGRVQADYRSFSGDEGNPDTWSIRRARFNTQLGFYQNYLLRLEIDHSAASTRLVNGYVEANWWPQAKFRIGQFKTFKSLENSTTDTYSDFLERSLAYNTYGDDIYERGAMVYGTPFKGSTYAFAVTNGTGQGNDEVLGTTQSKDGKDVTLRATINPAQWAGWDKTVTHVGGWYNHGIQATASASASQTEARGVNFFAPAAFTGDSVDRTRYGVETALAQGPVKFQGEYDVSNYQGTSAAINATTGTGATPAVAARPYDKDIKAWYAEAMWLVTGENYADSYKDGQFGRILPKTNFELNKNGWGALELGLRYSKFDASDFAFANGGCSAATTVRNLGDGSITPAGTCAASGGVGTFTQSKSGGIVLGSNEADAWTLGAKWILNPYTRIMMNYVHTKFDTNINVNGKLDDKEDALTMRAQLDF